MSFGYSVGDFVLLAQLAWTVVDNSRKACGEHGELAREVNHLHMVLQRLSEEVSKPDSLLSVDKDDRLDELRNIARDCRRLLGALDKQLARYNALTGEKRSFAKVWQQVKFGNGMMKNLNDVRLKVSSYTSVLTLYMNLLSIGSQGRVERHMYAQGGELREMRHSINWITATIQASHRESSILTSYTDDDKAAWKQLRRELIRKGFSTTTLKRNKDIIKKYLLELGERGILDEKISSEHAQGRKGSESSNTARSESNLSDSGEALRQISSGVSELQETDQYGEASSCKDKGKARDNTEDTQQSNFAGVSSHKAAIEPTIYDGSTQAENNAKNLDNCTRHIMSPNTASSITNAETLDPPVPEPEFIQESQDIDSHEAAHPNCEKSSGVAPEINCTMDELIPRDEGEVQLESPSKATAIEAQDVTARTDIPSKTYEIHKETDAEEAVKPYRKTPAKVFFKVMDIENGSECPVMATYLLPSTTPRSPPKIVGSDWFQWRNDDSFWRISEIDQAALKQNSSRDLETKPPLTRVVVIQTEQKKEAECPESANSVSIDSVSKVINPNPEFSSSNSDPPRAVSGDIDTGKSSIKQPRSPEIATLLVGGGRRAHKVYYRSVRGKAPTFYHNVRRTRRVSYPSLRTRQPIYYTNARIPRALWQPQSLNSDKLSDGEDWVDDPGGPSIIEVSYTNRYEPEAEFSGCRSRSRSLPPAAAVIVDSGRRRICYYRGYYRSLSTSDDTRGRRARTRITRSRSARGRSENEYEPEADFPRCRSRSITLPRAAAVIVNSGRQRICYYRGYYRSLSICDDTRGRCARTRITRSRSARGRSESTSSVEECERIFERVIYYGRNQSRPVYEYDRRTGTVSYPYSRPRTSRRMSRYHPARIQYSTRRSSVTRRRIVRTTTL